jgi:predicted nuclease of restriction endonuclease-like (RecB) superfamily
MKLTKAFFDDIRALIQNARTTVARGVNLVQVHTNFEIGRRIVEQELLGEDRAAYGKEVMKALAERLTQEFGKGFSHTNLKLMRLFYLQNQHRIGQTASDQLGPASKAQSTGPSPIGQTLSGKSARGKKVPSLTAKSLATEIGQTLTDQFPVAPPRPFTLSWSHYVFLLGVKNPDERSFYEIEATTQGWTLNELKRQFNSSLYERLALSRDKKGIRKLAQDGQSVADVQDLLKEPLVLEFLGLDEQTRYSESDLETAIISQIERFLLELGKGFLFEARQRRFTFDAEHYFVDLVFYNRLLRCYVLLDLKLGKLTHQDLGQMQMYVNYFDRAVKTQEENSTIGIILCKEKNSAMVRITLPKDANIHAREYQLYLPSKEELQRKLVEWTAEREARDE